jgi:hypothetical protein
MVCELHVNKAVNLFTTNNNKKVFLKPAAGMAEVVEHLLSKHKALSSKPSTTKQTSPSTAQNSLMAPTSLGVKTKIIFIAPKAPSNVAYHPLISPPHSC